MSNCKVTPIETHSENLMQILFLIIQKATETGKKLYVAQRSGQGLRQIVQGVQIDITNSFEQFCETAKAICKDSSPHTITYSSKECNQRNKSIIQSEEFSEDEPASVLSATTMPNEANNVDSNKETPSTPNSSSFRSNFEPEFDFNGVDDDEINLSLTTTIPEEAINAESSEDLGNPSTIVSSSNHLTTQNEFAFEIDVSADDETVPTTTVNSDEAKNKQKSLEEAENNTADVQSFRTDRLKKHNCQLCTYETKYFSHLKRHMIMHTGERNFECKECSKRFATNSNLKSHSVIHQKEKSHKCVACNREMNESECCLCDNTHQPKTIRCDVCNYRAKDLNDLNLHIKMDAHRKPFKCDICSNFFSKKHHFPYKNRR